MNENVNVAFPILLMVLALLGCAQSGHHGASNVASDDPSTGGTISAKVIDFSLADPTRRIESRELPLLTSTSRLEGKYFKVYLDMADGSTTDPHYQRQRADTTPDCEFNGTDWTQEVNSPCFLAIQAYYTLTKTAQYFERFGIAPKKPVNVYVNLLFDKSDQVQAEFKFEKEEIVMAPESETHLSIAMTPEILVHEFGHFVGSKLSHNNFTGYRFLETFSEGFADLVAFLMTGQSELAKGSNKTDPTASVPIFFNTLAGRLSDAYRGSSPWVSTYAGFHTELAKRLGVNPGEPQFLAAMMSVYLKAMAGVSKDDDLSGSVRSLANAYRLNAGSYYLAEMEEKLWDLAAAKGLSKTGMPTAITVNGAPVGTEADYVRRQGQQSADLTIKLPDSMKTEDIAWPILGILQADLKALFENPAFLSCLKSSASPLDTFKCNTLAFPPKPVKNDLWQISTQQLMFPAAGSEAKLNLVTFHSAIDLTLYDANGQKIAVIELKGLQDGAPPIPKL